MGTEEVDVIPAAAGVGALARKRRASPAAVALSRKQRGAQPETEDVNATMAPVVAAPAAGSLARRSWASREAEASVEEEEEAAKAAAAATPSSAMARAATAWALGASQLHRHRRRRRGGRWGG